MKKKTVIKHIRNHFRLEKKLNYTAINGIRNPYRQEKETKVIKDIILRNIKNLFEYLEAENYDKPVT